MRHIHLIKRALSWCIFAFLTFGFLTTTLFASTDYWPTGGWRSSTPEEQGMDSQKLVELLEVIRDKNYAIDSITIIRNGYIVTDAYLYPFRKNTKHMIFSCTKSITSMLVGIAIDKGYINGVKQPVLEFFPEKTIANLNDQKRAISLENLLTMSSGLDFKEGQFSYYAGLWKMRNNEDWVQYIIDLPMAQAPGKSFEYSSGDSHLLSAIIQKATKVSALEFAKKHLFGPLGITDVKWPADPKGLTIGYGDMMLTPHDMAKLGLLYLNKGRWDNSQIVSEAWVHASTRKHTSILAGGYGYQWWLSQRHYMAQGYLGQFFFVVPEKNMVVVFTSNLEDNKDPLLPELLLGDYIIPAAVSSQPLAAQPGKKEYLDSLSANLAKSPPKGVIWTSEENGVAKEGEFIRAATPAFRFRYPETSIKRKIDASDQIMAIDAPDQVMAMKTLEENKFSASVSEIPAGTNLADVGPRVIVGFLKNMGADIHVISNKKLTLEDGTPAYRTDINWVTPYSMNLRSLYISAFEDGKWVRLSYTIWPLDEAPISEMLKEGASLIESLTIK